MIKILLADDHTLFREGLKQIIAKHTNIKVVCEAGTGFEVLEQVKENEIDLVVLDISMPNMSVFEIITNIKTTNPKLPILILSMHPEEQYAIRLFKAGVSGYLSKECAAENLINAINKVTSGGKYISGTLAETLAFAIDKNSNKPLHQLLSNREFEVMKMIVEGKELKEIADLLCLSEKTITTYRSRVLEKFNLRNNVELTRFVLENKII
ncbi:MAG: response regulator transcription factor [bacterium]